MDKRVVPGEVPKEKEEQVRLEEAMRLYKVIDSITATMDTKEKSSWQG